MLLLPVITEAQLGAPLINITFGDAAVNPGPPLPAKNTGFNYSADPCPPPGYYTITNSLYRCASTRMGRSIDNTPGSKNGYMMVVNDTVGSVSKTLFVDTLKESLCPGTIYQFSAYFLNVEIPGYCSSSNVHLPSFTFSIENTIGQVLESGNTGPIPFAYNLTFTPKFYFYSVAFTMPAGINNLVLRIKDDSYLFTDCGYAFAVDDIQFAASGPKVSIGFDGENQNVSVKTVCFQDSATISMSGAVASGLSNGVVQWQQSIDSGFTWNDIPGAATNNFSKTFSTAGNVLLRMRASEADKIDNSNCSAVSNTLTVIVNGIPTDYKISSNSPVCVGAPLLFHAEGEATFEWTGPNGFYDNVGYASIYNTKLTDSGTYYAKVKSYGGCVKTDSLHVEILGSENVTVSSSQAICKGNTTQLNAAGGTNYAWNPETGLSNSKISNPKAGPEVTTTYQVKVSNNFGCVDSAYVKVSVLNSIQVKAMISGPNYICRPVDSALFKDVSAGNINSWQWDFGNGMKSTLKDPPFENYFIQNNTRDYTVHLVVADNFGCSDTAFHKLTVEDNCYIAVPSAFTPNGDGLNDYLYPLNAYKATDLLFRVYNRYGVMVFETTDWTKKWDGKRNGVPVSPGVYVWQLQYRDQSAKRIFREGSTLLIR